MASYHVNRNAQPNGDHEVHVSTCTRAPDAGNQLQLGEFAACGPAVTAAQRTYRTANGCYYCCNPCHTG